MPGSSAKPMQADFTCFARGSASHLLVLLHVSQAASAWITCVRTRADDLTAFLSPVPSFCEQAPQRSFPVQLVMWQQRPCAWLHKRNASADACSFVEPLPGGDRTIGICIVPGHP